MRTRSFNTVGTNTVMIADHDPLARRATREALLKQDDFAVVGEVNDGLEAVAMALDLQPDVVLMEAHLPGISGMAATRAITDRAPGSASWSLQSATTRSWDSAGSRRAPPDS